MNEWTNERTNERVFLYRLYCPNWKIHLMGTFSRESFLRLKSRQLRQSHVPNVDGGIPTDYRRHSDDRLTVAEDTELKHPQQPSKKREALGFGEWRGRGKGGAGAGGGERYIHLDQGKTSLYLE